DHVAECAVGLLPPPRFAQPQRKLPAVGLGMFGDQLTDKFHFRRGDHPAPVAKLTFYVPQPSRDGIRTQGPNAIFSQPGPLTCRQTGAACAEVGSPPASST